MGVVRLAVPSLVQRAVQTGVGLVGLRELACAQRVHGMQRSGLIWGGNCPGMVCRARSPVLVVQLTGPKVCD